MYYTTEPVVEESEEFVLMYYNSRGNDVPVCMGNPESMNLVSCDSAQKWVWFGNQLRAAGTLQCMSTEDVVNVKGEVPFLADCDSSDARQTIVQETFSQTEYGAVIAIGVDDAVRDRPRFIETVKESHFIFSYVVFYDNIMLGQIMRRRGKVLPSLSRCLPPLLLEI